jgi:hypothetical protein
MNFIAVKLYFYTKVLIKLQWIICTYAWVSFPKVII